MTYTGFRVSSLLIVLLYRCLTILNQCAQLRYRRSQDRRSTSCPCEASRERRPHIASFSTLLRCNACVFNSSPISRCRISSRHQELCFSQLRVKQARSRRQSHIYEICSKEITLLFLIFWEKSALNKHLKDPAKFYKDVNKFKSNFSVKFNVKK